MCPAPTPLFVEGTVVFVVVVVIMFKLLVAVAVVVVAAPVSAARETETGLEGRPGYWVCLSGS